MTPFVHAAHTAHRWGGDAEDYVQIHAWLDVSKAAWSDPRHRAFLHHREGAKLAGELLAPTATARTTRQVAEDHVIEDLGFLATMDDWFALLKGKPWMVAGTMNAQDHAQRQADRYRADPALFLPLHAFIDGGEAIPQMRHTRAWLHHGLGIHMAVARFGEILTVRPGLRLPVRELVEDHIKEDCAHLPCLAEWYAEIPLVPWMFRTIEARRAVCSLTRTARSARQEHHIDQPLTAYTP